MNDFSGIYDLKELNKLRAVLKLPLLKKIKRECLFCEKKFSSEGHQNRLCEECRKKD